MSDLIHELIFKSADRAPDSDALIYQDQKISYAVMAGAIESVAAALFSLGLDRNQRLAVYLEKNLEGVIALFGTAAVSAVFVPINPFLKPEQVAHILQDCNVKILVTSTDRLKFLARVLPKCPDLHTAVIVGSEDSLLIIPSLTIIPWNQVISAARLSKMRHGIDSDMASIIYTSGSTGKPKGVVLSHCNLLMGAKSVAQYLKNCSSDRILSVLPLSFDYGLNQITTAFYSGATGILINYLLPQDIISIVEQENITGLAAVPSLWIQLAQLDWSKNMSIRYITNSGGGMPRSTLNLLRKKLPHTEVFLMYGFTEAFRSTFLAPQEIDIRPDSIGKAIPNAKVLVLREDGSSCAPNEPGELVHCGALVSMGYWNDPERTAERFRPLLQCETRSTVPELAVWSGDTVRVDEEGFLYFINRRDEMIKTSGYRISPTEIEEIIYATELVEEVVVVGVPHSLLGQAIVVIAIPKKGISLDAETLLATCKSSLPTFMLPSQIKIWEGDFPRNSNGKTDRKILTQELEYTFTKIRT